jgi:hypothetical protein
MPSNQPNIPYVQSIYTETRCLKFEVEKSTKLVSKKTAHLFKAGMGGGRLGSRWSASAFHYRFSARVMQTKPVRLRPEPSLFSILLFFS